MVASLVTMETSQLHYTSPNHPDYLIASINNLRQSLDLCDVTLRVGDCSITAHRLVLCACSPFFSCLFTQQSIAEQGRNISLPGFFGDALKSVIEFFYTSAISVTEENVWKLFPTSHVLQVTELENVSRDFLLSNLQAHNAFKTYLLAEEADCPKLGGPTRDYILSNIEKIIADGTFCELSNSSFLKSLVTLTKVNTVATLENGARFQEAQPQSKDDSLPPACLSTGSALKLCLAWLSYRLDERLPFLQQIIASFPDWKDELLSTLPTSGTDYNVEDNQLQQTEDNLWSKFTSRRSNKDSDTRGSFTFHENKVKDTGSHGNIIQDTEPMEVQSPNKNGSSFHYGTKKRESHIELLYDAGEPKTLTLRCMFCDDRFSSQWELDIHLKTHGTKQLSKLEKHFQSLQHQNRFANDVNPTVNGANSDFAIGKGGNSDGSKADMGGNSFKENLFASLPGFGFNSHILGTKTNNQSNENHLGSSQPQIDSVKDESLSDLSPQLSTEEARRKTGNSLSRKNWDQFPCPHCEVVEDSKLGLMKHINEMHTGDPEFSCTLCEKSYSSRANLQIHMRSHSGERPYSCDHCSKSFSSVCVLRVHARTHSGERPFSCPTCGVAFAKNIHLKRHLAIHTGEKPHECTLCSKRFSRSDHLKRHIQSIHSNTRPHVCALCAKDFVRKYELNKHMKTHHNGLGLNDDSSIAMDTVAMIQLN